MKARYGIFALMLAAGALAAGELAVADFANPACWRIGGARVTLATKDYYISKGETVPYGAETADSQVFYMMISDRYIGRVAISRSALDSAEHLVDEFKLNGTPISSDDAMRALLENYVDFNSSWAQLKFAPFGETGYTVFVQTDFSAVPEPSTWLLALLGCAGLGFLRRRRFQRR